MERLRHPAIIILGCALAAGVLFACVVVLRGFQGYQTGAIATYTPPPAGCPVTVPSGVTTCYFVSAAGSDSNAGTTELVPWLHAPFMPNCSSVCHTVQVSMAGTAGAGLGFIFRGGDTWHFGDSSLSPYSGGTWNWSSSGLSGSPIYIGVDPGWYNGGSWSRPVMNGDNPLSTTAVASCPYQTGSGNIFLSEDLTNYLIWDNFEFTGKCQKTYAYGTNDYVFDSGSTYTTFEHMYFHGCTHIAWSCSGGAGLCYGAYAFLGSQGSGKQTGLQYLYDVFDGSDSDPASWGAFYDGMFTVAYCVFNAISENIANYAHLIHDNIFSNFESPGDGYSHGNVYEEVGEANPTNAVYNNVFHGNYLTDSADGGVCFWLGPINTATYVFNNVFYDSDCGGNFINVGRNNTNQGIYYFFNNTLENPQNTAIITFSTAGYNHPIYLTNNHYITDSSSAYLAPSQDTTTTELLMTHATATVNGYTASQTYAFSPISGISPTVGTGTNGFGSQPCGTLATAALSDPTLSAAATACKSDTAYACSYNNSNHTVSCPARTVVARPLSLAWDIGAYEY